MSDPAPGVHADEVDYGGAHEDLDEVQPLRSELLQLPAVQTAPAPGRAVPLLNRELSWLEFNRRVLAEAENQTNPLLERLKFASITANNLDEFLMVRVGGIRELARAGVVERTADGLTPLEQLEKIRKRTRSLVHDLYAVLNGEILPGLASEGIRIDRFADLDAAEKKRLHEYYEKNVAPILTPLAIDPAHPFPFLSNLTLNLAITAETSRGEDHVAFVRVPPLLPRWIPASSPTRFIPLENLIAEHACEFFPGLRIKRVTPFRVLRYSDISIREDEVQDLLQSVESELRRRDRREVVVLEIAHDADESLVTLLTNATNMSTEDVISAPGLLRLSDLMQIYNGIDVPGLKDPAFNPRIPSQLASSEDIFSIIRRSDLLLHRPYDSFTAVVEFVQAAAQDPDVVAIKQTLYRTDEGSPIVEALISAALSGKQVTALVELQARFDEMKNITWAKRLETAGVQVVYGLLGFKTHCKLCLVVRREGNELRRYVHLSTGNYNARTARLYTDIDLFTCDPAFGDDSSQLMNILTGFSVTSAQEILEHQVPELKWKRFVVSPLDYHVRVVQWIEREIEHARAGRSARIIAKMNALVDPTVIDALYRASEAGVRIDLIIRGICCLIPGLPKTSENIKVLSVIDRFLEHARIYYFENGGSSEVWVASGDWMPRNFVRRIETAFPILNAELKRRLIDQILGVSLADTIKGWRLQPDGSYKRRKSGDKPLRSQERFIEIARSESVRIGKYEEILHKPGSFRRKAKKPKKKEKSK